MADSIIVEENRAVPGKPTAKNNQIAWRPSNFQGEKASDKELTHNTTAKYCQRDPGPK